MTDYPLLSRLDLNLLVALDALLTERSVTRAAEQLHLSQPALSASLARLRTHFNDPILARRGNAYELTPLALRLSEHTTIALDAARRVFESQATWTPRESTREFSIYGSDYGFATIGAAVSRLAKRSAPSVRFRFMLHNTPIVYDAANSLRSVDAMVIPHGHISDLPYEDLWRDRWVVVADESNALVENGLTMRMLGESPWVFTYRSALGVHQRAGNCRCWGWSRWWMSSSRASVALGHFIIGTQRLGLVQAALAPEVARLGGIRILEAPFDATPTANALWWHPVHDRDPEHAWMRALFLEASHEVQSTVASGHRYIEPLAEFDAALAP